MKRFSYCEGGLYLDFEVSEAGRVHFLHFSALPLEENDLPAVERRDVCHLYELQVSGFANEENHSLRYMMSVPGLQMRYAGHRMIETADGRRLEIDTRDAASGLCVRTCFAFYRNVPAARCWNEITNEGQSAKGLEHLSSFEFVGVGREGLKPVVQKMRLHVPQSGWQSEMQWVSSALDRLGYSAMACEESSGKRVQQTSIGSWSSCECLPMAILENVEKGVSLFWQIETPGGWHWELSDVDDCIALNISGPNEIEHHWWKQLQPGETFATVPVCVGCVAGGCDSAVRALTEYRRALRGPAHEGDPLPVIFNDYMNCLWASPTTEKELPMIRAAAQIGCEYYVVDAGWYTDGEWWYDVGEWLPSAKRFPGGLREVMDAIRDAGMIPGIWLEIETMGIRCPKLKDCDDSWFFMRHGKRIVVRGRYQLDFSNPAVRAFASEVIRRVVEDYGVGYIKMDYNINAGIGTERGADSFGDGLLRHERAYLNWLDEILARYPRLILENCASGGMRMDYAMMRRSGIQSTSDQSDYRRYVSIAVNAPAALLPEQSGVWCYPIRSSTREEIIFNIVNAALLRMQVSGNMDELSGENRALVRQGIEYHKRIREEIRSGLPFWPTGFAHEGDGWASLGMACGEKLYVAVWRLHGEQAVWTLKVPQIVGKCASVRCSFPEDDQSCQFELNPCLGTLTVALPNPHMARILEITILP